MDSKKESFIFQDMLHSLNIEEKVFIENLNRFMISLGFIAKIAVVGKKGNDWKCEYVKKKNVLLILRITNDQWSARLKLFHLLTYEHILEKCNKHFIETLLSNSKDCENHGGGCEGPISFSIKSKKYSKCRHYFLLKNVINEDIENIKMLIEGEDSFIK
jgi:hypothetical protein